MLLHLPEQVLEMVVKLSWSMILWNPQQLFLNIISFLVFISNSKLFIAMEYKNPDQWVRQSFVLHSHIFFLHNTIQAHNYFLPVWQSQIRYFCVPLPQLTYVLIFRYIVPVLWLLNFTLFSYIYYQNRDYLKGWSMIQIVEYPWYCLL